MWRKRKYNENEEKERCKIHTYRTESIEIDMKVYSFFLCKGRWHYCCLCRWCVDGHNA